MEYYKTIIMRYIYIILIRIITTIYSVKIIKETEYINLEHIC